MTLGRSLALSKTPALMAACIGGGGGGGGGGEYSSHHQEYNTLSNCSQGTI